MTNASPTDQSDELEGEGTDPTGGSASTRNHASDEDVKNVEGILDEITPKTPEEIEAEELQKKIEDLKLKVLSSCPFPNPDSLSSKDLKVLLVWYKSARKLAPLFVVEELMAEQLSKMLPELASTLGITVEQAISALQDVLSSPEFLDTFREIDSQNQKNEAVQEAKQNDQTTSDDDDGGDDEAQGAQAAASDAKPYTSSLREEERKKKAKAYDATQDPIQGTHPSDEDKNAELTKLKGYTIEELKHFDVEQSKSYLFRLTRLVVTHSIPIDVKLYILITAFLCRLANVKSEVYGPHLPLSDKEIQTVQLPELFKIMKKNGPHIRGSFASKSLDRQMEFILKTDVHFHLATHMLKERKLLDPAEKPGKVLPFPSRSTHDEDHEMAA